MTFIFISAAVFATDCVRKHVHALSIISTISASPTFFHYMLMSDHMQSSCCTIYNKTHCKSLQHFFAWVLLCRSNHSALWYDIFNRFLKPSGNIFFCWLCFWAQFSSRFFSMLFCAFPFFPLLFSFSSLVFLHALPPLPSSPPSPVSAFSNQHLCIFITLIPFHLFLITLSH